MTARTIMIMAGGTGGHIMPGLAVAEELRAQGWKVVWLGSPAGMEARLVPPRGYDMAWIRFSGVRGKGLVRFVTLPLELLVAFWQSARAIFAHRPDVVLGMGGYVAFPGGMMAALFNRPLALHEQNSVAGLTNRVLAQVADRILTGFPDTFGGNRRARWTGNPVRAEIAALPAPAGRYAGRAGPLSLLVVGGSLGAKALNDVVPQALARLALADRPRVVHQSGAQHVAALEAAYREAGVEATVTPFIDDMAGAYAGADLVICRAGASTIAELAAAGVASVLVPFPHAVDDHQTANARFLAGRGAALLIPQPELTPEKLAQVVREITRGALAAMAERAREAAKPDATQVVAQACRELAHAA
jgi:UDP-N-acetylglucosamine--N-acetylmuramyl-(pentapeptide) pyrophosphoryl-undecaprenol N-acetylglucosamine transferase